ncbi:MAG: SAM-dependent methyltransferase [Clostridium sp.]|nr:SAM-dependent methyltransferase [Clostridium sp.]
MSKRIELTPRLAMVAELVPEGARLTDVGTDHAYLPAALIQQGKIPSAIAADLRQGPLSRARMTAQACELGEKISFRLCDGLVGIRPLETDAVVIAGMGGETIAHILSMAPWTRDRDVPLILQPMSSHGDLRRWLAEHGYQIRREQLCQEGDTLYLAMLVGAGEMSELTAAEQEAGCLDRDPLRGKWLDRLLEKSRRALEGVSQARTPGIGARREELEQLCRELEEMKKEWETWLQ